LRPDFILDTFLDIITLTCGVIGALLAFFGEAVRKPSPTTPRLLSITPLGWTSMGLLVLAFIAGVWSKVDSGVYQQALLTKVGEVSDDTKIVIKQLPNPSTSVDAQLESLVIRQEVQENPPKEPGDRTNKLVTFYVDVKKDSSVDKNKLFSRIKSVIYHFDHRWFSNKPEVEINNITEDFRYSIGVWGSTRFSAEIVTSDPPRRLLRGGYIDTVKTAIFE
jgi:hypothetical protein